MSTKPVRHKTAAPTMIVNADGSASLDLSEVPDAPLVGFATDVAIVERAGGFFEFTFWETVDRDERIPVARFFVAAEDLVKSLWPQMNTMREELNAVVNPTGVSLPVIHTRALSRPAGPAPLINVMPIARHGQDALIDCHYVSPRNLLARAQQSTAALTITPVFSVTCSTVLLVSMLRHLHSNMPAVIESLETHWQGRE